MKYQEAFTKKYKISASDLLEQISTKFFGNIKSIGLEKLINEQVEEKGILPNEEFYKMLIEAIAEGNIKLPENQKLFIENTRFQIPNKEVSIPKSKGVLQDFKEIVATDDMRPVMKGVYISEDGFLVATDAHILVKYQSNEFSEEKGKIIDLKKYIGTKGKAIDFIDEKYPQYDRVIPQDNEYKFKGLSTYAFYNFAKSTLFLKKLTTSVVFTIEFDVKGEKYYINPNLFSDLLEFALAKGFNSFDFEISESKSKALVLRFEEKSIGLIMPILAQESNGTIGYTFDQIENVFGSSKSIGKKKAPVSKSVVPKAVAPKSIVEAPKSVAKYKKFEGDIEDTEYISRREIASISLRSGEVLSGNDIIDGFYRAKKKFAIGGLFKKSADVKKPTWIAIYQKGNEIKVLEVNGNSVEEAKLEAEKDKKRYNIPQEMFLYDIYRKFAEGGEIAQGNYEMMLSQAKEVQHHITELQNILKKEKEIDAWVVAKMENISSTLSDITHYLDGKTEYAQGGNVKSFLQSAKQGVKKGYEKSKEYTRKKIHDTKKNIALEVLDSTKGKVPSTQKSQLKVAESIVEKKYAKGGKIGFEGLANKVAKRYVRKKVSKEYQAEYGKTYDAKEAKEVGNKVAGKVYQQQVAKKKIVRKLQRKTN